MTKWNVSGSVAFSKGKNMPKGESYDAFVCEGEPAHHLNMDALKKRLNRLTMFQEFL